MGQAGLGITNNVYNMLIEEGLSDAEARSRIFPYDLCGLLSEDSPGLTEFQKRFVKKNSEINNWILQSPGKIGLFDIVKNSKATVLIGVTATYGLFTQAILSQMAQNDEQPVIFSLSNPTIKSECTLEEVVLATKGRALVATGSPFTPVEFQGNKISSAQCNNMFIFPGIGLGALVSRATRITTKMFLKASLALSNLVTEEQAGKNMLLPELSDIRSVSLQIAKAVAIEARDSGLGRLLSDSEYEALIKKAQWEPEYYPYRRCSNNNH
jgi:malate dehydrogenase (oxaloacetate-decarboxylating)